MKSIRTQRAGRREAPDPEKYRKYVAAEMVAHDGMAAPSIELLKKYASFEYAPTYRKEAAKELARRAAIDGKVKA